MDLRPKLADDFLDAILKDLETNAKAGRVNWGSALPEEREALRAEWKQMILDRFVSQSIRCEECNRVSCDHEGPALAFIEKYPGHAEMIEYVKAEALRRWPDATFSLELHSDPESGHIVYEGQHLTFRIQTGLGFYGPGKSYPEGSPYDAANTAWEEEFIYTDEYQEKEKALMGDLHFAVSLLYAEDE